MLSEYANAKTLQIPVFSKQNHIFQNKITMWLTYGPKKKFQIFISRQPTPLHPHSLAERKIFVGRYGLYETKKPSSILNKPPLRKSIKPHFTLREKKTKKSLIIYQRDFGAQEGKIPRSAKSL